jgi:voltage-gated potassium channel Kch
MSRWRSLLLGLLAGLLLTVGLLVAPMLFTILDDRALAGTIAGHLFAATAAVAAILTGGILVTGRAVGRGGADRVFELMPAALLGINELVLHPLIAVERQTHGSQSALFALWHGLSSVGYLVATASATIALWRSLPRR